jgi:Pyridine nucleotide-disulphide oxidoreductase
LARQINWRYASWHVSASLFDRLQGAPMTDCETIIVGAGPAGLACAAALSEYGRPSLVLERSENIASAWHRHYDRLHLHTHRMHSGLPGRPMPRSFPKYPSRRQVIAYLEDYARSFKIETEFGREVTSIRKQESWSVATAEETYKAKNVIVATGLAHTPIRPHWKGQESFAGKLVHSSEFKNAADLDAERVLVVGFGNSAGEVALECAEAGSEVGLSVRSPVNVIPREMFGVPTLSIAIAQQYFPYRLVDAMNAPFLRLRFGDIGKVGLRWARHGPLTTIMERGRTPLIDIGTMGRIRSGDIRVFGEISHLEGLYVCFNDDRRKAFDAIVLATGYRPALAALFPDSERRFGGADGPPRGDLHPAGDGLYFCGFNVVPTGHLRQIGKEAQQIAELVA